MRMQLVRECGGIVSTLRCHSGCAILSALVAMLLLAVICVPYTREVISCFSRLTPLIKRGSNLTDTLHVCQDS